MGEVKGGERRKEELQDSIEKAVGAAVEQALQKHERERRRYFFLRRFIALLLLLALAAAGGYLLRGSRSELRPLPVEGHDQTLENSGILGFQAADFKKPMLGAAIRRRLLIVEEQETYVNTTITDAGLFNWGVFHKQQVMTIHGTGQYTVDLTKITGDDISLDATRYEVTIRIPHAELHQVVFDPSKTEVGDAKNGWLAFGNIKLSAEQQKEFEIAAKEKLQERLSETERFQEADRFARLSAYEMYQPIVEAVSPAYRVAVEFK